MNSSIFWERARKCKPFSTRIFVQFMGGGPRTFPGGINKWQWKRLHEKRAIEKEKRLLHQEKQEYEARIRSEIRSIISGSSSTSTGISSKQQVKLLADRFTKEGAEDLWNEFDGPSFGVCTYNSKKSPPESPKPPLDLSKLINGGRNLTNDKAPIVNFFKYDYPRSYSTLWTNPSYSSTDDEREDHPSTEFRKKRNPKLVKRGALRKIDDEALSQEVDLIKTQHEQRKTRIIEEQPKIEKKKSSSTLSSKRFGELDLSPPTIKALEASGYVHLTNLQSSALPSIMEGKDALIKAKTVAHRTSLFLLPSIEAALKAANTSAISALVLCSTRESASRISAEASAMISHHSGILVQALHGGKRFKDDVQSLKEQSCKIIVATPGRLIDHIENKGGICGQLMGLKLLVVDEGDKLIELGFWEDIETIIDCLPRTRQTLLFTFSVSNEIRRLSLRLLRKNHVFVDSLAFS